MEILTSVKRLYISFKSPVNDSVYSFGRAALLLLVEVQNHTVPVRERGRIRVNRCSNFQEPQPSHNHHHEVPEVYILDRRANNNMATERRPHSALSNVHNWNYSPKLCGSLKFLNFFLGLCMQNACCTVGKLLEE